MIRYYRCLLNIFNENGFLALCYLASTKMPNPENCIRTPILYIYGGKATGKTEFVKFMFREKCLKLHKGSISIKKLRESLRKRLECGLVHLDDINEPLDTDWRETIKSGYDIISKNRLIISGSADLRNDITLFTRTIFLDFSRTADYSKEEKELFREYSFIRDFAYLWDFDFKQDNRRAIESLLKAHEAIESRCTKVEHRLKENYKSLLAGYLYFSELFSVRETRAIDMIVRHLERQQALIHNEND